MVMNFLLMALNSCGLSTWRRFVKLINRLIIHNAHKRRNAELFMTAIMISVFCCTSLAQNALLKRRELPVLPLPKTGDIGYLLESNAAGVHPFSSFHGRLSYKFIDRHPTGEQITVVEGDRAKVYSYSERVETGIAEVFWTKDAWRFDQYPQDISIRLLDGTRLGDLDSRVEKYAGTQSATLRVSGDHTKRGAIFEKGFMTSLAVSANFMPIQRPLITGISESYRQGDSIVVNKLSSGLWSMKLERAFLSHYDIFKLDPAHDNKITSSQRFNNKGQLLAEISYMLTKIDGISVIQKREYKIAGIVGTDLSFDENKLSQYCVVEYDLNSIRVNTPLDKTVFTFAGMGLSRGDLVEDFVPPNPVVYRYEAPFAEDLTAPLPKDDPFQNIELQKSDGAAHEIQILRQSGQVSVPPSSPEPITLPASRAVTTGATFFIVGGIVLVAASILMVVLRLRKSWRSTEDSKAE
jgi:hypothetical protein